MTGVSIPQTVATAVPAVDDDTVIDVRGLRMRYGTNDVLDGVGFTVGKGEVVALLGPERRGQDHHDRDPRGLPDALGRRGDRCSASTRRTATKPGGPASASCCSPGATTASGGSASCSRTSAATTPPTRTDAITRPWDTDELIEAVGLAEHADKKVSPALRRPAAPARRGDRHRRAAGGAVPRRAHGRLRPGGPPRVPRPRAPAGRRSRHHDPADHPRPRRGGEAGRPHPHPRRRPDHRRRHAPTRCPG